MVLNVETTLLAKQVASSTMTSNFLHRVLQYLKVCFNANVPFLHIELAVIYLKRAVG